MSNTTFNPTIDLRPNDRYDDLLSDIRQSFNEHIAEGKEPLFTTDANERIGGDLYSLFVNNLPADARQHYECRACRNFVNRYGGIVRVNDNGELEPIMWKYAPTFFGEAILKIYKYVKDSKITGVFITDEKRLGTPKTGEWTHMSVDVPKNMTFKKYLHSVNQVTAEKNEDFKMVLSATRKYQIETAKTAVNLLRSESMYRSVKIVGIAEWFLDVIEGVKGDRVNRNRRNAINLLWKKVATAPAGFCHISGSVLGTVLDDIEEGLDFEAIRRKFNEKMDPLHYQRPQVAPSTGNVARAEKIVAELGLENSLKRRFARLEEIETIWKPVQSTASAKSTGVFSSIKTKNSSRNNYSTIRPAATIMTWDKFQRTVLPIAKKIELYIPSTTNNYAALVTAENYDAPSIIKYDFEDRRNPISWYMYSGGSTPSSWNLASGIYVNVTAITLQPNMWQPGFEHLGSGVIFILDDCKDTHNRSSGLFPELLRNELHEVRATIEAYSQENKLGGYEEASACGLCIQSGNKNWRCELKVTTDVGESVYKLDRWD